MERGAELYPSTVNTLHENRPPSSIFSPAGELCVTTSPSAFFLALAHSFMGEGERRGACFLFASAVTRG